jgi:hypothetical protein
LERNKKKYGNRGWLLFIFLKRNLYDQDYSWNF